MAEPNMAEHTITIPGRLCVMGEHSDWAADYRLQDFTLPAGTALVIGLSQALTATATAQPDTLALDSALAGQLTLPIKSLLPIIRSKTSPWRYAAAVAYLMQARYTNPQGLKLTVTEQTLPAAKGFSSSAAICVLAARAYNLCYDLQLTVAGEMEVAYAAERMTGSKCGRMDQIVAIGRNKVARMHFDIDFVDYDLIDLSKAGKVYIVIADLGGKKNTSRILNGLHDAYPHNQSPNARRLRYFLGERNQALVQLMQHALCKGDAPTLGKLMTQAQREFDQAATPFCPDELEAPRLHQILTDEQIQAHVHGGKGVGSQGDGAVQLVAVNKSSAQIVVSLLHEKCGGKPMIITPSFQDDFPEEGESNGSVRKDATEECDKASDKASEDGARTKRQIEVTKVVIPTAGYATRLFPASRIVSPKSLLPIIDGDGFAKPILLNLVEEAVSAGLTNVTIVTAPGAQQEAVQKVFTKVSPNLWKKLKPNMQEYAKRLEEFYPLVNLVEQKVAHGFGHAVACGVPDEEDMDSAFMVLLGDVVFQSRLSGISCMQQVVQAYRRDGGMSMIGVTEVEASKASAYGVVETKTELRSAGDVAEIKEMVEKPTPERLEGICRDGVCDIVLGPYVFSPAVMHHLKYIVRQDCREHGEIQLTSAMQAVIRTEGMLAYRLDGLALDTGNAVDYASTFAKMAGPLLAGEK